MKRPLLWAGIAFTIVSILFKNMETTLLLVASVAFFASGVCFMWGKTAWLSYARVIMLSASLAMFSLWGYNIGVIEPCLKLSGQKILVSGVVVDFYEIGQVKYLECMVKMPEVSGVPSSSRIQIRSFQGEEGVLGEGFTATVKIDLPKSSQVVKRNAQNGIFLTATLLDSMQPLDESPFPIYSSAARFRRMILENISHTMKGNGYGLATSLVTGDRSRMDRELEEHLKRSGLIHMVAVSGMHLGMISKMWMVVLSLLGINKRIAGVTAIPILWFYVYVCGCSPSAMRSGVMLTIALIGGAIFQKHDTLTSLGFACIVTLLSNPYMAGNVGFQMSYLAVVGITLLSEPLKRLFASKSGRKYPYKLIQTFCHSMGAWLLIIPVSAWTFGYISLFSPLSNLLVSGIVPIAMIASIFVGLLGGVAFLAPIVQVMAWIAEVTLMAIAGVATLVSNIPISIIPLDRDWKYLFLIFFCVMLVFAYLKRKQKFWLKFSALMVVIAFLAGTSVTEYLSLGSAEIVLLEQATILKYGNQGIVLNLQDSLYLKNPKENPLADIEVIPLIIIEEEELFSTSALVELVKEYKVERVAAPDTPYVHHYLESIGIKDFLPLSSMTVQVTPEIYLEYEKSHHTKITIYDTMLLKKSENCDIIKECSLPDPKQGITVGQEQNIWILDSITPHLTIQTGEFQKTMEVYRGNK